jgi:hypothetical protein
MSGVTSDPNDPGLTRGVDSKPVSQANKYLVLSEYERSRGFVRPLRYSYIHTPCGTSTTMSEPIARTYAKEPTFYGATYCVHCRMHKPVGADGEFVWEGTDQKVGT